ncbi:hypothetical protein [Hymenobacter arizonensis]|uniref:Outer membrane protein beta-barrel domain-containing protein n=1 Tax=Hymenobacter arizonensis TaxID=1227077 RepID=A0A1I6B6B7_HYMAR|nr:hypothetical protein [Hymenobacter arizonensis]SFQ76449.1 hypothetical protein SAMN04515668_4212 [Hymenobacter arizonensis]
MANLSCFRSRQTLAWIGLLVGSAFRVVAQTVPDTTQLKYGEEVAVPSATDVPLRVQEEQRSLWKLGLNNFLPSSSAFGPGTYYTRYGLHLAYERKLDNPDWSVLGEVSPAITRYRPDASAESRQGLGIRTQVAGRYYHNRERRLLQGRNVGSFFADYVSVALGTGLGNGARETQYFLYRNSGQRFITADVALLYGLQRRLGRYGFIDANNGVAVLLLSGRPVLCLTNSLRVGLTLGPQPARYVKRLAPASEVVTLRPRFYVGSEIGGYFYRVRYSEQNPYPNSVVKTTPTETQTTRYPVNGRGGYGTYAQYVSAGPVPYVYGGYYLAPRWAIQLGINYGETFNDEPVGTVFQTGTDSSSVPNQTLRERGFALPVMLRYALTTSFLKRLQFDAVGGLIPLWSSVNFREYAIADRRVTTQETFGFRRRAFGVHAALGVDASYAFGRRRRVQATFQYVMNKDVRTFFEKGGVFESNGQFLEESPYAKNGSFMAGGGSFGLRYRFGYR